MNSVHQSGRNCKFEEAHPGCFGKLANLFELNSGLPANRLLTDVSHWDGRPISGSRSAMSRKSPCGDPNEKQIVSDFNNSFSKGKLNGMPMKKLVAPNEVNSGPDVPNLVAKLMGLDSLPHQEPDKVIKRSHSRGNLRSLSNRPVKYHQQSVKSAQEGICEETINNKKMTLVRQKFIEAKRLTMDKKLYQSNQFQDALEVLSSNKELFLKCLQEPNSMLYHHSYNNQSISPSPERKRITILSPSMTSDVHNLSGAGDKYYESSTQPTRIVVLKPGHVKLLDLKAASPQSEAQRVLYSEGFFEDVEDESKKSREEVIVTDQVLDTLGGNSRNETLNSSALSLGYVGDQSSFSKSEIECEDGNISNSDVMPSASRHSWDNGDRIGCPSPAFSQASSSPKLSVSREAKRRLSERWVRVSINGSSQEPNGTQGRSITLREMLALSNMKEAASPEESSSQQLKCSNSFLVTEVRQDENVGGSSRNLLRSKSVPSSKEFDYTLNMSSLFSDKDKVKATKEPKTSAKSSLKGKISNLFFSRNRKPGKDKYIASETKNEVHLSPGVGTRNLVGEQSNIASPALLEPSSKASSSSAPCDHGQTLIETNLAVAELESGKQGENQDHPSPISVLDPPLDGDEHTRNVIPHDGELDLLGVEPPFHLMGSNLIDRSPLIGSVTRTCPIINSGVESPVPSMGSNLIDKSPLIGSSARTCSINNSVVEPLVHSMGANLIDKSPLLGSVERTRSWNNSCDPNSSHRAGETISVQKMYEEDKEWNLFVHTLLSVTGLDDEVQSSSLLERWHLPESPLDPSLRDKYMDTKGKEARDEATCKQKQLTQTLVFDCVNAALLEIAGDGLNSGLRANNDIWEDKSPSLVDEVWAQTKAMFSGVIRCALDDCGDSGNYVAMERVVRKEVAGKLWAEQLRLETDSLGKEIADKLVGELVQEMWLH